ncbi:hypothetical protein G6F40_018205 [Rhizopus arrhizus]|nr:hypothetical protein G6F40_018205 [Rhizopus arrhizus]
MMGSANPPTGPTCRFQFPDELPALHTGTIHIVHTPRQSSRRQYTLSEPAPSARPAQTAPPGPRRRRETPAARG